jgi:hypothetical protein
MMRLILPLKKEVGDLCELIRLCEITNPEITKKRSTPKAKNSMCALRNKIVELPAGVKLPKESVGRV